MVVVGSRIEAVRWRLAIDTYIKAQGYKIGTLVAFSGEVNDSQSGSEPFSETQCNPVYHKRQQFYPPQPTFTIKGKDITKSLKKTNLDTLTLS